MSGSFASATARVAGLQPSQGNLTVNVFDGRRVPFTDGPILLTIRDGNQSEVIRREFDSSSMQITGLTVFHNAGDNYAVLTAADGYRDAGFFPVKIAAGVDRLIDLLLLPQDSAFNFSAARWIQLASARPEWIPILASGAADDNSAGARYADLMDFQSGAVMACLLNLLTAMGQAILPEKTALNYLSEIIWDRTGRTGMAQDRFFGWADPALIAQLETARQQNKFASVPYFLHPGATRSYKQLQFGEADLQLTFHENDRKEVNGVNCVLVEPDIDYYKDPLAHLVLEILVNTFGSLTDPRQVYALRWIAGRQAGVPEFNPLYEIQKV